MIAGHIIVYTYILEVVVSLDRNKSSSAPPHIANNSSRIMITDPRTPPTMLALIFKSLPITFSDPIEAEIICVELGIQSSLR